MDTLVGVGMLTVATVVFVYYSLWTFLVPFVDPSHPIAALFPDREWAVRIPALLLVLGVLVVGSFIGITVSKSNKKKRAKLAAKKNN